MDQALVERCVQGDREAWNQLVTRYQSRLLALARRGLERIGRSNGTAAEDVVARVWLALVEDNHRLLRGYDAGRGTLWQYLTVVARSQLVEYCRTWQRWTRDRDASDPDAVPDPRAGAFPTGILLQEFLQRLPRRARQYCQDELLPGARGASRPVSPAYAEKLRQRVLRELRRYLDEGAAE